jgi:hypothetical protein
MENNNNDNYGNVNRNYQNETSSTDFEKSKFNNQDLYPSAEEFIDNDPNRFYNDDQITNDQNLKHKSDGELSNEDFADEWDGDEGDFYDIEMDKTDDDFEEKESDDNLDEDDEDDEDEDDDKDYRNGTEENYRNFVI